MPRPRPNVDAEPAGGRGGTPPTRSIRERLGAIRNIPPFLALIWATSKPLTVWTVLLRLVRAVLPVATLYIGKLIIDEVMAQVALGGTPTGVADWLKHVASRRVVALLAIEFGLAVLSDVLGRLVALFDSLLSEQFSNATSIRLMAHAATLDLEDFEDSEQQDKLERARRQASFRMTLMNQLFGQAQDLITIVTFGIGLVAYAPWLIGLLFVALIPAFLGEAYFNERSYSLAFSRTADRRELDYIRQTGASVETAKEVKIFGLNGFLIDRYRQLANGMYAANRALAIRRAGWGGLLTALGTLGYYGAYALIVFRTLTGQFSIGDLTFLSGSFRRLRTLLEGLLIGFTQTASQALYLDDLFSFFDVKPEILSPPNARPFPAALQQGIVFENVGFQYPGAERWAVRNLSFTLRAGEVLALVGENGAGKTTIVKLLARLYDPDEGRILVDGFDMREYDLEQLRANIGVIFQDFVRYNMTAAENISVGRIEARGDMTRIQAAAERSLASDVIAKLPKRYQQQIGKRFRKGVDLSGGEWQKVAIARAYMRDAQLLILDEPTAALDARAEYEVFERFKELSAGKTGVLISHRFSSVRMADRILVLADGAVEASGTHAELLAARGRYAELFELQAAGYR